MTIIRTITAGSDEKSDALITVSPGKGNREIHILRIPHKRFEGTVLGTVKRVLDEEDVQDVSVTIEDNGALDFVIEARTRAAVKEAIKEGE